MSQNKVGIEQVTLENTQGKKTQDNEIVVNVYFSGTGHRINDTFVAAELFKLDQGVDARDHKNQDKLNQQSKVKFGFDGCRTTHGPIFGMLFGAGVKSYAREVERFVRQCIREGKTVKLNIYGHSRGAISGNFLVQYLSDLPRAQLETRFVPHDPVPGNFRFWTWLDRLLFGANLANQSKDLSKSRNLVKVHALYPQRPLDFIQAHVPLMASYPEEGCDVTEEVTGGCHAAAQYLSSRDAQIAALRAIEIMKAGGANFDENNMSFKAEFSELYEDKSEEPQETIRLCHSDRGVYIKAQKKGQYLNIQHAALENSQESKSLKLMLRRGFLAPLFDFDRRHPWLWRSLKWLALGAIVLGTLFLTGGLGAIPLMTPLLIKFGALALTVMIPAFSALVAGIWHALIMPIRDSILHPSLLAKGGRVDMNRYEQVVQRYGQASKLGKLLVIIFGSFAENKDNILDIFVSWFRASGIQYRQQFYRNSKQPCGLEGMQMLDDLNPFAQVIETADHPMARIYRTSVWTGIKDAFHVLMGNHYDLAKTGKGRKGVLDLLIFPVIARRLLGYAANQERPVLVRAVMGTLGVLLEIPRAMLGIVLTIVSIPFVALVHLVTLPKAKELKQSLLEIQVAPVSEDKQDIVSDDRCLLSALCDNKNLDKSLDMNLDKIERKSDGNQYQYGNKLFKIANDVPKVFNELNIGGQRTYGLEVL